jgi:hypothetical protein
MEKTCKNDVANFCQSKIDLSTFNKLKKSNNNLISDFEFYFIFAIIFIKLVFSLKFEPKNLLITWVHSLDR